jgi:hypothetical protein
MDKDFLFIPAVFVFWVWIVWFVLGTIRRYKTAKLQLELRNRLLDKLGSSQEVLGYLQTDAGKQFLGPLTAEQRTPYSRIIGALEISAILVLFGGALLLLRSSVAGSEQGFVVFGALILALGLGFGLAGGVSYLLSKRFGLLGRGE